MWVLANSNRFLGAAALLGLLVGVATLGLPTFAGAEEAPPTAPSWDDSHMRSNHVQPTGPVTRPPIQGASGYSQLADGTAEPTRTTVPETLESATQRQWEQGRLVPADERPKRHLKPGSGPVRGSALRQGAVSRRRH